MTFSRFSPIVLLIHRDRSVQFHYASFYFETVKEEFTTQHQDSKKKKPAGSLNVSKVAHFIIRCKTSMLRFPEVIHVLQKIGTGSELEGRPRRLPTYTSWC